MGVGVPSPTGLLSSGAHTERRPAEDQSRDRGRAYRPGVAGKPLEAELLTASEGTALPDIMTPHAHTVEGGKQIFMAKPAGPWCHVTQAPGITYSSVGVSVCRMCHSPTLIRTGVDLRPKFYPGLGVWAWPPRPRPPPSLLWTECDYPVRAVTVRAVTVRPVTVHCHSDKPLTSRHLHPLQGTTATCHGDYVY